MKCKICSRRYFCDEGYEYACKEDDSYMFFHEDREQKEYLEKLSKGMTTKVRVIETNISMSGEMMIDHQSRVIEVESWESLIEEIRHGKSVRRNAYLGNMSGHTLPREPIMSDLQYDEQHMSCIVYGLNIVKKLFYLIKEN